MSQYFKDRHGHAWTVEVTVATVRRVRALTGVDLLEAPTKEGGSVTMRLASDPVLLADVLYAVVKPQADAQQVSDEAFGEALAGDAIDAATRALLEALVDFFPSPRDRERARRAMEALGTLIDKAQTALDARLDADVAAAADAIDRTLGPSSTASPASAESTPQA